MSQREAKKSSKRTVSSARSEEVKATKQYLRSKHVIVGRGYDDDRILREAAERKRYRSGRDKTPSPFVTLVSVNVYAIYCATAVKSNQQPLPALEEFQVPGETILRPATATGNESSTSDMPATQTQGAGEISMYISAWYLCKL